MIYLLDLAYQGTAYSGWQTQNNGLAVQQVLNEVLSTLLREPIVTLGSGRTDAGVHARQQIAQFSTDQLIDPEKMINRINGLLPDDIAVQGIYLGKEGSHVRFDALSRTYRYFISLQKDPFRKDLCWRRYGHIPNLDRLNSLSKPLIGRKDFSTFSKVRKGDTHFECEVYKAFWVQNDQGLVFEIKANRFLRGMVRLILGTMMQLEFQKAEAEEMLRLLESKNRRFAATLAPATGLFLWQVAYPEGYFKPIKIGGQ